MHPRYLEDRGEQLIVRASPLDRLARGAGIAFVIAPLVLVASSGAASLFATDDLAFLVGWGTGALAGGALALLGIAWMVTAPRMARRYVRFDLAERILEWPGGKVEVLRGVEAVRVRAGRWPWSGFVLELAHEDGRATALLRAPRAHGRDLTRAAEHLAEKLGTDARVAPSARQARPLVPRDPRIASALTYMPIDGLSQALAIYYLMTAIDPFTRFNAKQSLLMLPLEALGAMVCAACFSAPLAIAVPDAMRAGALACPLIVFAGARAAIRTMAAMRARRGLVWIQPWLAPISRRWAPT